LHTTKILRLSQGLPIVIEIVDAEDKIKAFVPTLEKLMGSGLVTLEKVKVLRYGDGTPGCGLRMCAGASPALMQLAAS
jgi:PII-like signaling protein